MTKSHSCVVSGCSEKTGSKRDGVRNSYVPRDYCHRHGCIASGCDKKRLELRSRCAEHLAMHKEKSRKSRLRQKSKARQGSTLEDSTQSTGSPLNEDRFEDRTQLSGQILRGQDHTSRIQDTVTTTTIVQRSPLICPVSPNQTTSQLNLPDPFQEPIFSHKTQQECNRGHPKKQRRTTESEHGPELVQRCHNGSSKIIDPHHEPIASPAHQNSHLGTLSHPPSAGGRTTSSGQASPLGNLSKDKSASVSARACVVHCDSSRIQRSYAAAQDETKVKIEEWLASNPPTAVSHGFAKYCRRNLNFIQPVFVECCSSDDDIEKSVLSWADLQQHVFWSAEAHVPVAIGSRKLSDIMTKQPTWLKIVGCWWILNEDADSEEVAEATYARLLEEIPTIQWEIQGNNGINFLPSAESVALRFGKMRLKSSISSKTKLMPEHQYPNLKTSDPSLSITKQVCQRLDEIAWNALGPSKVSTALLKAHRPQFMSTIHHIAKMQKFLHTMHKGSFCLIAEAGAFSDWHLDIMNGTFVNVLMGHKAWFLTFLDMDNPSHEAQVHDVLDPHPADVTCVPLTQGAMFMMASGHLCAHMVLGLEDSICNGTHYCYYPMLHQVLRNLRIIFRNQTITNELIPNAIADALDDLLEDLEKEEDVEDSWLQLVKTEARSLKKCVMDLIVCKCSNGCRPQRNGKVCCPCKILKSGNQFKELNCCKWCPCKMID